MNEDGAPAPTTLIDLLHELVEPAEPPPVTMTPQTWGWAVLAVLLALALAWLAWRAWRRWRANAYRRAALAELAAAGDDPVAIAGILRRTALAAWPRERVASLTGRDWLAFLDATGGGGFAGGPGAALAVAPYRDDAVPVPGLGEAAALWVRRHRVEARP
ncbi:MAG TPA: DUF4381 domain-containing protein [Amaricoccus sp.]|mgnify:CR=1 FL=1|uniref:DUF4381 domain-containing protein n=1 Tax=Amaricoccus sp. TaxID=1872485 RepID=UPI002BB3D109|nr:DUF4381 domain-containing protein [Amaricoccus sp.]HMQ95081.1 DUF4381 domain-containing protein [Amaricoccus sp.]HMR53937.1 DUF4381 domain-containing protein [Amaricoccus sp.]HMR62216.1 DUF4381 domain-containing protein [Amaricoccus sp.]HMU00933.1 DUF4381 domain-containing protein [Amaricoccus sp.]